MRITFFDINPQVVSAWGQAFGTTPDVEFQQCDLNELEPHDVLVTPGNSFGIMDGGIDRAISKMLSGVQEAVTEQIGIQFFGEQPVGTSMIVSTGHESFPYLAHTPTMFLPGTIPAINVYHASRGLFTALRAHEVEFETVACPGLGTLSGRVRAMTAASMMKLAYDSVMVPKQRPKGFSHWAEVYDYVAKMGEVAQA